jgi:hypothetical protein
MMESNRSFGAHRGAVAAIACTFLLALSTAARAQPVLPATPCDAALANPDLHPQPDMPLEDGLQAFSYTAAGAFVSGAGGSVTITVALTFQPEPDSTIRISALDDACAGGNSAGTVFTHTFGDLTSTRNTLTYDAAAGEIGFNGTIQKTTAQGTPRYLFVDVWDGQLPSTHATHSYVIDLLNPMNPTTPQ